MHDLKKIKKVKKQPSYELLLTCSFCHKIFKSDSIFLSHSCKQKKRMEEASSPMGMAACSLYQTWFRKQNKVPPRPESFISSKYFRTFILFAEFVKQVKLPTPDLFISLMLARGYPPYMWRTNDIYIEYLMYLDTKVSPLDHVEKSIETLQKICNTNSIPISDFYSNTTPEALLQLLELRQISIWIIFFSSKFKQLWKEKFNETNKIHFKRLFPEHLWTARLNADAELKIFIESILRELNI